MCLPKTPDIPQQQAPQEVKPPDTAALSANARRNRAGSMSGGTLLTGPSGAATGAAPTGRTTLLGG